MATNSPANSTPPDTPNPGPPGQPGAIDPLVFAPTPSALQQPGFSAPAANACPMPAGPVRVNPTQNGQDFASAPFAGGPDPAGQST